MADMLPELVELNHIRLDEDKTFGELAKDIGLGDQSSLFRLLKEGRQPQERTLYKIRKYLERRKADAAKPKRRRSDGVPAEAR